MAQVSGVLARLLLRVLLLFLVLYEASSKEEDLRYKDNAKQYVVSANATTLERELGTFLPALAQVQVATINQGVQRLRILCWVNTYDQTHHRALAIKETWGRHCDKLLFMSNVENTSIPTVRVVAPATHDHLWQKHRHVARLLAREYQAHTYDWIFKCDDDTFVVMENLKQFLASKATTEPAIFGHRMTLQPWIMQKAFGDKSLLPREYRYIIRRVAHETKNQGGLYYTPGGAGYAFNAAYLSLLVESLDEPYCLPDAIVPDDWAVSFCMFYHGIVPTDTRDAEERERFHQYSPEQVYFWPHDPNAFNHRASRSIYDEQNWFSDHYGIGWKNGTECCAPDSISFHYVYDMARVQAYLYRNVHQMTST